MRRLLALILLVGCQREYEPRAIVLTPSGTQGGEVPVDFILKHRDRDYLDAEVAWSSDGGASYRPASPTPAASPLTDLKSSVQGRRHRFVWDARKDLGPTASATVRVRVHPVAPSDVGAKDGVSGPFRVETASPAAPGTAASTPSSPFGFPPAGAPLPSPGAPSGAPPASATGPSLLLADGGGSLLTVDASNLRPGPPLASLGGSLRDVAVGTSVGGLVALATSAGDLRLYVLDPAGGGVKAAVDLGGAPEGVALAPAGDLALVTLPGSAELLLVDLAGVLVAARIPVGREPVAVAPFGGPTAPMAYVANAGDGTLSAVDLAARRVVATVPVGGRPRGVAVVDGMRGRRAYVTDETGTHLAVVDASTHALAGSIPVGAPTWGLTRTAYNGITLFVTSPGAGQVHAVDLRSETVRGSPIDVGGSPRAAALVIASWGARVITAGGSALEAIDAATLLGAGRGSAGTDLRALAVGR
ncbi:MAG: hypothetical protein HY722_15025 [Planctomycetes bacterium]|nr:hypothetical protein [Planctomycetota bacterium]